MTERTEGLLRTLDFALHDAQGRVEGTHLYTFYSARACMDQQADVISTLQTEPKDLSTAPSLLPELETAIEACRDDLEKGKLTVFERARDHIREQSEQIYALCGQTPENDTTTKRGIAEIAAELLEACQEDALLGQGDGPVNTIGVAAEGKEGTDAVIAALRALSAPVLRENEEPEPAAPAGP